MGQFLTTLFHEMLIETYTPPPMGQKLWSTQETQVVKL